MSLSRALFFLSLLLTLLAQGPVCCDGATTATNSFYFSFSSIYSYPAEQMYLTFFFICHSTISLSELSFRRVFFFSSLSHVCIHFKQFFVTCFIHARRSSSLSLSPHHQFECEGRKTYGGKTKNGQEIERQSIRKLLFC